MTKETDKISVIVPVYNVKNYLEDCVQSITHQTYPDLEILLIDDGSDNPSRCDIDLRLEIREDFVVFQSLFQLFLVFSRVRLMLVSLVLSECRDKLGWDSVNLAVVRN